MKRSDAHYAGASGKVSVSELGKLGAGFVLQPKMGGIYGLVSTDAKGRITSIGREGAHHVHHHAEG